MLLDEGGAGAGGMGVPGIDSEKESHRFGLEGLAFGGFRASASEPVPPSKRKCDFRDPGNIGLWVPLCLTTWSDVWVPLLRTGAP